MTLAVDAEWPDRYDDRLAALPDGTWASATDRAVTVWRDDRPAPPTVSEEPRPGPLVWLPGAAAPAWGAGLLDDPYAEAELLAAALPEVDDVSRRHHRLTMGGLDGRGTLAAVATAQQPSRAVAGRAAPATGPPSRLAIVERTARGLESVAVVGDDLGPLLALSWADGPLLAAGADGLRVVDPDGWRPQPVALEGSAAVLALHADTSGRVAAGRSDGSVTTWSGGEGASLGGSQRSWSAHEGPIHAVAWSADGRLATGGVDGWLRLWSAEGKALDASRLTEPGAGDPGVAAVCWLGPDTLIAKLGGQGGRLARIIRAG